MSTSRELPATTNQIHSATKQVGLQPTRASEDKDFATCPHIVLNIWQHGGYNSSVSQPEPRSTCVPTRHKARVEDGVPCYTE